MSELVQCVWECKVYMHPWFLCVCVCVTIRGSHTCPSPPRGWLSSAPGSEMDLHIHNPRSTSPAYKNNNTLSARSWYLRLKVCVCLETAHTHSVTVMEDFSLLIASWYWRLSTSLLICGTSNSSMMLLLFKHTHRRKTTDWSLSRLRVQTHNTVVTSKLRWR